MLMNLKIDSKYSGFKTSKGIVYVLVIELEDCVLVKVGVTLRSKIEDRVSEILVSIWKKYRVFPRLVVKRFSSVVDPYDKEKMLHTRLKEFRYITKHKFSGSTEVFKVDTDTVVHMYDNLVKEAL